MNLGLKIVGRLEFRPIARRPTDPDPFEIVLLRIFHMQADLQFLILKFMR